MPLTTVELPILPDPEGATIVVPAAGTSPWIEAIPAGGLIVEDSGGLIRKAADIAANDAIRVLLERAPGSGTTLRVRMVYSGGDGAVTEPLIIRVFGGDTNDPTSSPFAAISNVAGDQSVPVRTNVDADSVFAPANAVYTQPDNDLHSWDCDGYKYILIGVEQAYTGTYAADAYLQAKIV